MAAAVQSGTARRATSVPQLPAVTTPTDTRRLSISSSKNNTSTDLQGPTTSDGTKMNIPNGQFAGTLLMQKRRSRASSVTSVFRRLSSSARPSVSSQASHSSQATFVTNNDGGSYTTGTVRSNSSFSFAGDKDRYSTLRSADNPYGTIRSTASLQFAEQPDLEKQQLNGKRTLRTSDQIMMLQAQIKETRASLDAKNRERNELVASLSKATQALVTLEEAMVQRQQNATTVQADNAKLRAQVDALKTKIRDLSQATKQVETEYQGAKRTSQVLYSNYMRMLMENEMLKVELQLLYEGDESTSESEQED